MMAARRRGRVVGAAALAVISVFAGISIAVWLLASDTDCRPVATEWSVARRWDEALLDAIRRDVPAPTVHSRNLYHMSVAMWDAWAAYDPAATGVVVDEHHVVGDIGAARDEAISYAAFRILEARYIDSIGAIQSIPQFDQLMAALCYPADVTTLDGNTPAAVGNRIAAAILRTAIDDGSNEAEGYVDPTYEPVNEPLVVSESGTVMIDANRWQPLHLEEMISQNGLPVADASQEFIDPHWGGVAGFALPPAGTGRLPMDPGPPPYLGDPPTDAEFKDAAVEVIRFSSLLDPVAAPTIDISPAGNGANPLGTNDGAGYDVNPVTGEPYAPNLVNAADFGRVLAEFWADGPDSETPPGHWNTVANTVSDQVDELRIGGTSSLVDRLEWDVKLYLALNGAVHDAAVAGWGAKGFYDYVRPISMIRFMGGLGQSSNPDGPSYHPDGLPLAPGLIEVVTGATAGGRHGVLAGHEGEIAIRAWSGNPADPENAVGGVSWILAADWVPYQKPTFVTPAFAGYVSGHSTFSRAAAEVMTGFTGSEYFPGGLGEWKIEAGALEFEAGPSEAIVLQWATYRDAADQAGISRLYGGIHVRADDLAGRVMGADIGRAAWERAQTFYGSVGTG